MCRNIIAAALRILFFAGAWQGFSAVVGKSLESLGEHHTHIANTAEQGLEDGAGLRQHQGQLMHMTVLAGGGLKKNRIIRRETPVSEPAGSTSEASATTQGTRYPKEIPYTPDENQTDRDADEYNVDASAVNASSKPCKDGQALGVARSVVNTSGNNGTVVVVPVHLHFGPETTYGQQPQDAQRQVPVRPSPVMPTHRGPIGHLPLNGWPPQKGEGPSGGIGPPGGWQAQAPIGVGPPNAWQPQKGDSPSDGTAAGWQPQQAPYAQAPYAQAPYAQAPYAQAPYAQAPYAKSPYAATPHAPAPYAAAPDSGAPNGPAPYARAPAPYDEDERPNAPAHQWQTQGAAPVGPGVAQPQGESATPDPATVNQGTTMIPSQNPVSPEGTTVPPVPPSQTAATPEGSTMPPAQAAATTEATQTDQDGTTTPAQNAVTPEDPASATTTTISSQMTKEDNATVHQAAQAAVSEENREAAEAVNAAKVDKQKHEEEQKNNTVWIVISICALVVVFLGLLGSCFAISMSPSPSERQATRQTGDALAPPLPFPEPAAPRQSARLSAIPEGVPPAEVTTRPSLAAASRASVAGTARPSVLATTRPSVAATTRPSVAATTRPSLTTTTRPSVRGSIRPPPAEETVEVVEVVEDTVQAPGTESTAKTSAVLEFKEEEMEEDEEEGHTGEDIPKLRTQFSSVEEGVEAAEQETKGETADLERVEAQPQK